MSIVNASSTLSTSLSGSASASPSSFSSSTSITSTPTTPGTSENLAPDFTMSEHAAAVTSTRSTASLASTSSLLASPSLASFAPEIIIIGAGIAGSALSFALSNTGRKVLLIERDLSPPDRIVGELLQPGGVDALRRLGMGDCLEGLDATPVEGYCVVMASASASASASARARVGEGEIDGEGEERAFREVAIPYPEIEKGDEVTRRLEAAVDDIRAREGDAEAKAEVATTSTSTTEAKKTENWSASGKVEGRSFHHGRFVDSLRRKVISQVNKEPSVDNGWKGGNGNVRVLEGTVKQLITCDHTARVIGVSVIVKAKGEQTDAITTIQNFYAPLTIVADGCFSKFRTVTSSNTSTAFSAAAAAAAAAAASATPTTSAPPSALIQPRHDPIAPIRTRSHFVGLILQDVPLPRPRHGTVCLTPNGPVLLYQIGNKANETRMLIDVKGKLPSVADGSLRRHIESSYLSHLPSAFIPSITAALDSQRLRVMPNSYLPPKLQGRRGAREGVIMVGDAWNMRHPLTGGGMTVAFHDAVLLTEYLKPSEGLKELDDWEEVRTRLREWYWRRKNLASVVNILSIALYDLFGADDPDLEVLREGCFAYFELGGTAISGPVGLLSALTPKPMLLFYHFFSVAFYSIWILFTRGAPSPSSQHASSSSSSSSTSIITPSSSSSSSPSLSTSTSTTADKKSLIRSPPSSPRWTEYPALSWQSIRVFYTACVVLLPVIWSEFKI